MRWNDGFIAVDWGTTNRRAYRIDGGGACNQEFEDDQGILAVAAGAFPAAVAQIRERLGELPLLLAGMVGSNRGWVEAPYVPCPAGLDGLVSRLAWPEPDIAIVPGVSFADGGRADVMRGEEVQLLGAVADGLVAEDATVCHPGTHNKWVQVRDGRVAEFRTVMTGEMFNLLKDHSILSDLLQTPVEPGPAFVAGVRHAIDHGDMLSELFAVRARVLLGVGDAAGSAAYASGLLIGSDLRIGLAEAASTPVTVMGRPELTSLFGAALAEAGVEACELDGERCFLAGANRIAQMLS